jgi:glutaredoxin-like YruB-family protein
VEVHKGAPRIIVFSTPNCPWCTKVKRYLKEQNCRFRDVDISKDDKAAKDVVRRTGQMGVPVVLVNNKTIIGFNKKELDRILNIN